MEKQKFTKKYATLLVALAIFLFAFGGALVANFRAQVKTSQQTSQQTKDKGSKVEQIQKIAKVVKDIAPYIKTQDGEAIVEYFVEKACNKVPVENKEACANAVMELIILAQQAGSLEELVTLIKNEIASDEELQAIKNDLMAILTYTKQLITDQQLVTQEQLQTLGAMIKTFLTTYGDVTRMAMVLSEYACPQTQVPEACKIIINDLLYGYTEGQDAQTTLTKIAQDLKNLTITSLPTIHEEIVKILQVTIDVLVLEEDFIGIRYSEADPQNNPTRTVYEQGRNAFEIHINDLNNIYSQIQPILQNPTEENLVQLKGLTSDYIMELVQVTKSYQQFYPAMRGGVAYVTNYKRNEFLTVGQMLAKDLISLMKFYQDEKGKDTTSVIVLIDHEPTSYKQIGGEKNITSASGYTLDLNTKIKVNVPTDAGLIQLDSLTQTEISQANEKWYQVITDYTAKISDARVAQAEAEIYQMLVRKQKYKIAKEICKVFANNTENCTTNVNATINTILSGASQEEIIHVFCQNKPNPSQCEQLKNIITSAIEDAESVEEFVKLVQENTKTPVTPQQIQAKITELQTLLEPLVEYLNALIDETDGIDQEDIYGLIEVMVTIIAGTEKGGSLQEKTSGMLCGEDATEEEIEECRNTIKTVMMMYKNGSSQEEIINYLLTQVDSVDEIKEHADKIVQAVYLLLITNRLTSDFLKNREGEQSIGVTKLVEDYNALYPLYEQLNEAYKALEGDASQSNLAKYIALMTQITVILQDYYLQDLTAGVANTSNPAEARFMRNSEIFGYDTTSILKLLSDLYGISVEKSAVIGQQILNDSRTGKGMVPPLKTAWDEYLSTKDDGEYDQAITDQTTMIELIKKINEEKMEMLAELQIASEEASD